MDTTLRFRAESFLIMVLLGGALPIAGGYLLSEYVPTWRWTSHEFHHLAEGLGAFVSIVIAIVLLSLRAIRHADAAYVWLAFSFIGMAILDAFHSVLDAGQGFVWLHSSATTVGGLLATLVWLPDALTPKRPYAMVLIILGATVSFGVLSMMSPEHIPTMIADGGFTSSAELLNLAGGLGYIAAAIFFATRLERLGHIESLIFSTQAFLFGIAALLFDFSELWDGAWWLWHVLRLIAIMVVAGYFFRLFLKSQRDLIRYNEQLESANKELETFAYSVSHDLRAPLRAIDGFSQALVEEYADKLDGDANLYLERLRAGSQTMGRLIDGILKLSRSTRGELALDIVDLSEIAKTVAEELTSQDETRTVTVRIAPTVTAYADARLMRAVLDNLIGNAWKFTRDKPDATIEFGAERSGDMVTVFVRDNGAGFDMAYADKLFAPFQRLHRQDEFEGTGIGLSTVERIVHRHGGRIWAESAVGQGATFFLQLHARRR